MRPPPQLSVKTWGGGGGTRPWWLALLACRGAYWPLAFEPSAMTSRHPYYCGHPHCRGHPPSWGGGGGRWGGGWGGGGRLEGLGGGVSAGGCGGGVPPWEGRTQVKECSTHARPGMHMQQCGGSSHSYAQHSSHSGSLCFDWPWEGGGGFQGGGGLHATHNNHMHTSRGDVCLGRVWGSCWWLL